MPKRKIAKYDITKEQFFALLNKAAQPHLTEHAEGNSIGYITSF